VLGYAWMVSVIAFCGAILLSADCWLLHLDKRWVKPVILGPIFMLFAGIVLVLQQWSGQLLPRRTLAFLQQERNTILGANFTLLNVVLSCISTGVLFIGRSLLTSLRGRDFTMITEPVSLLELKVSKGVK
jgi:hypothetical protein